MNPAPRFRSSPRSHTMATSSPESAHEFIAHCCRCNRLSSSAPPSHGWLAKSNSAALAERTTSLQRELTTAQSGARPPNGGDQIAGCREIRPGRHPRQRTPQRRGKTALLADASETVKDHSLRLWPAPRWRTTTPTFCNWPAASCATPRRKPPANWRRRNRRSRTWSTRSRSRWPA